MAKIVSTNLHQSSKNGRVYDMKNSVFYEHELLYLQHAHSRKKLRTLQQITIITGLELHGYQ